MKGVAVWANAIVLSHDSKSRRNRFLEVGISKLQYTMIAKSSLSLSSICKRFLSDRSSQVTTDSMQKSLALRKARKKILLLKRIASFSSINKVTYCSNIVLGDLSL